MNRHGTALIEVLVALVILSSVGVSTLGYLSTFMDAQSRLESREHELVRAERVLAATALLARKELDLRLGIRQAGGYSVFVTRPAPSLYRISVARDESPEVELLATIVFKPEGGIDAEK